LRVSGVSQAFDLGERVGALGVELQVVGSLSSWEGLSGTNLMDGKRPVASSRADDQFEPSPVYTPLENNTRRAELLPGTFSRNCNQSLHLQSPKPPLASTTLYHLTDPSLIGNEPHSHHRMPLTPATNSLRSSFPGTRSSL